MKQRCIGKTQEIALGFGAQIKGDDPILVLVCLVVFLEQNHGTVGRKPTRRAALADLLRLPAQRPQP